MQTDPLTNPAPKSQAVEAANVRIIKTCRYSFQLTVRAYRSTDCAHFMDIVCVI